MQTKISAMQVSADAKLKSEIEVKAAADRQILERTVAKKDKEA